MAMVGSGHVLHMRAAALGALRRDLMTALGSERARGLLLRFGWALGEEDARALRAASGPSDLEWLQAGPRLHRDTHMAEVRTQVVRIDRERAEFRMEGCWEGSYEAREHLRHFGPSLEPVCWTLVGYAGGYASTVFGQRVIFREIACAARGDETCRFVGLPAAEWGVLASGELPLYEPEAVAEELEAAFRRVRRENDRLQHVMAVHDQLTHVVMREAGLNGIAEALGRLLGCAVAIEDRYLRTLALFGSSIPTLREILDRRADLRRRFLRLQRDRQPLLLPAQAGDRWGDLVVTPILLGEELFGFLTINVVEGLTAELTRMVAERAALACGLELKRERAAVDAELRVRSDFLDHLLAKGSDPVFLERWARHLGLDLAQAPHRFLLVQPVRKQVAGRASPPGDQAMLYWRFHELLEASGLRGIGASRPGGVVGLVECGSPPAEHLAEEVRSRAAEESWPVWVGVSRAFQGAGEAPSAFEECRALLAAMRDDEPQGRVVRVDGLGAMQLLFRHGERAEMRRCAEERLGPLIAYDAAHQSDLLQTLRLYLETACNLQATADGLNISVSGLKYRLQRIREVGGLDLADAEVRFDAMVALRLLALLGAAPRPRGLG